MESKHYITDVALKVLIAKENAILFVRETDKKTGITQWELPGGRLDEGETMTQCIAREMQEELGISVTIKGIHECFPFTSKSGQNHFVVVIRAELADAGQAPKPNSVDIDEVRWVAKDDVAKLQFWSQYKTIAEKFFDH